MNFVTNKEEEEFIKNKVLLIGENILEVLMFSQLENWKKKNSFI